MSRLPLTTLLWALAAVAAAALLLYVWLVPGQPPAGEAATHEDIPVADRVTGGPFQLPVSTEGEAFDLRDLEGQYVWLYFGYTSCPDACPVSLGWIRMALEQLPESLEDRVSAVFVSVDPERDDREHLAEYTDHFHPRIQAATGPHDALEPVVEQYGVFYEKTDSQSAMGYVIDHSSSTYLVGPEGDLLEIHSHGTSADELVATLQAHAERE
ncbi:MULTISPECIES: SCO family protein [unclassified Thioalkalivibrio]|uniref:SCO family protein n=1 Tax=unclassified Thioalkalivibrio TaxID=2621013 RepID=UPI0003818450|nr:MULTISPECIES: SCO family protein [unclassified Thioalkalivibrio]